MLDGKKQKYRDHREASVARSVLISATERLSEPRSGEFSRMADNRCTDRVGNAVEAVKNLVSLESESF